MGSDSTLDKMNLIDQATKGLVINQDTFKNKTDPEDTVQNFSVLQNSQMFATDDSRKPTNSKILDKLDLAGIVMEDEEDD